MRNPIALLPLALLTLAALPASAQDVPPRVLFCMGQCFGVDEKGTRVPVTRGTLLAPGQRLETGPDSYVQIKIGPDTACGIGEKARVRFDRSVRDRDVVILDEGRIRVIGGEAIGRPATRPVELQTVEGNFLLRSADIEVKTLPKTGDALPAPTLVKLNIGEARLGDLLVSKDAVQGIVGGKILDRVIPIGDIALTPRREPAPAEPGGVAGQPVRAAPIVALPILNLPATEPRPFTTPIALSPAIVSPEYSRTTQLTPGQAVSGTDFMSHTLVFQPVTNSQIAKAPVVPASTLILAYPITTPTGTTSLNTIATKLQTSATTSTTTTMTTLSAPLTTTMTLQQPAITSTSTPTSFLSPRITTTSLLR
jgi:hypothetical protein